MKSDLILLFGSQLNWFVGLSGKHRLYVLYFILSFGILLSLVDHPLLELAVVLNFGNAARLLKRVPVDKLED